jgi:tetratricopeptide (TPR) repeat protein
MSSLIQQWFLRLQQLIDEAFAPPGLPALPPLAIPEAGSQQRESTPVPTVSPISPPSLSLLHNLPPKPMQTVPSSEPESNQLDAAPEPERVVLLPNLTAPMPVESTEPAQPDLPADSLLPQQEQQLLQQNQSAEAITIYRQALKQSPSVEAYERLAQALSQQGNLEEAAFCYRKAIELAAALPASVQPVQTSAHVRKRAAQAESEPTTRSLPWYEEAALYLQQGQFQCSRENWDATIAACEQALELLNPKTAEAYQLLGQALQGKDRLEEARQSYNKALVLQPKAAGIYAYLGTVYIKQQQLEKAMECYRQALVIKPEFAEVHWEMGELWLRLGNPAQAGESWSQALQLKPIWAGAKEYWRLGTVLTGQEKLEQAAVAYKQAIQADANFVEAYHNLGVVLGKQHRWQEALGYHQQAVKLHRENPQFWAGQGRALMALDCWDEAIASYRQITQMELEGRSDYSIFQHALTQLEYCQRAIVALSYAKVAERLGQHQSWTEAIACYRQAIQRHPKGAALYAGLGKALAAVEQWEEAIASYQQAMELAPEKTDYYLALGDVLIRREQLQRRRAQLESLQSAKSENDEVFKEDKKIETAEVDSFTLV